LHGHRVGEPVVGVLLERAQHDLRERVRDATMRHHDTRVGHRVVEVAQHDLGRGVVHEGQLIAQQLEEHDAQAVEVAPAVHRIAAPLLRGHVVGRAAHQARARDGRLAAHDGGEAEVHDLDQIAPRARARQDDVLGLEVPVHDAQLMGFSEGVQHRDEDVAHALEGQRPLFVHDQRQVAPRQVLHRQVQDAVLGASEVDDAHAVRVVQAAGRARLLIEARDGLVVPQQVRVDDLDGDRAAERALLGAVHAAHAAHAHDFLERVRATDRAPDQRVGRAGRALLGQACPAHRAEAVGLIGGCSAVLADAHPRRI
jgi:hypothetical protein